MYFRNTHANLLCAAANKFEVYEKVCHHKQYSCNFFSLSCICGRLSIMYVSSWQKMTCNCPNSISLLNNEIKFLQTEVDLQYRYLLIFRFNYHTWTSTSEYKIFLLFKAIQNATKFKLFFFLWHTWMPSKLQIAMLFVLFSNTGICFKFQAQKSWLMKLLVT